MKKTITLIAILLVAMNAGAQYFHTLYADGATAGNGMATKYIGEGHLIGGTIYKALSVVRTNVAGDFTTADDFNNLYFLYDAASGSKLTVTGARVLELSTKDGYIAMGSYYYYNAAGVKLFGIFYLMLKSDGSVSTIVGYMHPKQVIPLTLTAITESATDPGDVYATGLVEYPGKYRDLFAMRIKAYGSLSWDYIYDFSYLEKPENQLWVSDILESPYDQVLNIVGRGNQDGIWITLDPSNGAPQGVNFYDLGKDERFSAIAVSSDPAQNGYVLCGTSTRNTGYNQVWAMKTKTLNTSVIWSYIYAGKAGAKEQDGVDIVGRLNTSGNYEYYLAAFYHDYPNGIEDNMVFKLPADGKMTSVNDVFLYPFLNNYERVASVDAADGSNSTGLSLYSTYYNTTTGASNLFITKAYFNGVTACNFDITYGKPYDYQPKQYDNKTKEIEKLDEVKLEEKDKTYNYRNICFKKELDKGDNSRLVQGGITGGNLAGVTHIYPNPLSNNATLHIAIGAEASETVQVRITDMAGRVIYQHSYTVQAGDNDLQVVPGNIAAGIYDVSVDRTSGTEHHKVAVH